MSGCLMATLAWSLLLLGSLTEAQEAQFATDRIIVKFKPGFSRSSLRARSMDILPVGEEVVDGLAVVPIKPGANAAAVVQRFNKRPDVEYAELDALLDLDALPNDPLYSSQWGLGKVRAAAAWDTSTGSSAVTVCVIDTGIDYKHPDLAPNVDPLNPGWNAVEDNYDPMDQTGHGTAVAGVIGMAGNNLKDGTGVAWKVTLLACKFVGSGGLARTSDAIACISYCTSQKARIINASWSGDFKNLAMEETIRAAGDRGALFVTSPGNGAGKNIDVEPRWPAAFNLPNMLTVASTGKLDTLSSFSNYGPVAVQLGAPGEDILTTALSASTTTASGTSLAVPLVSGSAALLLSAANGDVGKKRLRELLLDSAEAVPGLQGKVLTGGRLDLQRAMTLLQQRMVVLPRWGKCKKQPSSCELKCNIQLICWYRKKKT